RQQQQIRGPPRATIDSQHCGKMGGQSRRVRAVWARKRPRHKAGADLIASKPSRSVAGAAATLETYEEARRSPSPALSAYGTLAAAIAILDRLRHILGRDRSLAMRPNGDCGCGARRHSNHKQRTGHN